MHAPEVTYLKNLPQNYNQHKPLPRWPFLFTVCSKDRKTSPQVGCDSLLAENQTWSAFLQRRKHSHLRC